MRIGLLIAGSALILVGAVWIGQGTGYFSYPSSSFMIDDSRVTKDDANGIEPAAPRILARQLARPLTDSECERYFPNSRCPAEIPRPVADASR